MGVHGIVPPAAFADPVVLPLGLTDCAEADEAARAVPVAVDAVTAELAGDALGEALFTELLVHPARASEAAIRHVQRSTRDIDAPPAAAMDVPGMPAGAAAQPLTGSNLGWPSRSTRAWDLQTPHGPGGLTADVKRNGPSPTSRPRWRDQQWRAAKTRRFNSSPYCGP